jgi:hypothetical protein
MDQVKALVARVAKVPRPGTLVLVPCTRELVRYLQDSGLASPRGEGARRMHGFGLSLLPDGTYVVVARERWPGPACRGTGQAPVLEQATADLAMRTLVWPFVLRQLGGVWEFAGVDSLEALPVYRGGYATRLEATRAAHKWLAAGVRSAVVPYQASERPSGREVAERTGWGVVCVGEERRPAWPGFRITAAGSGAEPFRSLGEALDQCEGRGEFSMPAGQFPGDVIQALAELGHARLPWLYPTVAHAAYHLAPLVEGHEGEALYWLPDSLIFRGM